MNLTKEEIGARAAVSAYSLAVVVALLDGVSLGTAALRGALCAAGFSLLGQFLGGAWLKAAREGRSSEGPL